MYRSFRAIAVRAASASSLPIDMRDRHAQLSGRQGGAEGGVHVTVDDQQRGAAGDELALDAGDHGGGLLAVGAGPDAEVDVGVGQAQVGEEHVRHPRVVVLAGVDEHLLVPGLGQSADHRGGFHEVRPGTKDVRNQGAIAILLRGVARGGVIAVGAAPAYKPVTPAGGWSRSLPGGAVASWPNGLGAGGRRALAIQPEPPTMGSLPFPPGGT